MARVGSGHHAFLVCGALAQLAVWLVLRPDRSGVQWTQGSELEAWLAAEAVVALVIGVLAPDRALVVRTVLLGWVLQMLHLILFGEHYDDTLWGLGVFLEVVLAAGALAVALLARRLTRRDGRQLRT